MTVSETLRAAIEAALRNGITRYAIAKATSLDHTALTRFLAEGRDVRLSTVDALADYLGLELQPRKAQASL